MSYAVLDVGCLHCGEETRELGPYARRAHTERAAEQLAAERGTTPGREYRGDVGYRAIIVAALETGE